jgi:hypothetical protein
MTSPVDVANLALDQAGARFLITSLSPPLPAPNADLVARNYQPRIDALFRSAHWNCARRQVALTVLRAAAGTPENPDGTALPLPPVPYLYEYAYPADCLLARYLLANPPAGGSSSALPILAGGTTLPPLAFPNPGYKFTVAIDSDPAQPNNPAAQIKVILTDLQFAQLVYTGRIVNPDLWDPHFFTGAVSTLAAWLITPIKDNSERLKSAIAIASGVILQARVSDGNEGVTTVDHLPDFMAVRGFSGLERVMDPQAWYGWEGLTFPGGVLV